MSYFSISLYLLFSYLLGSVLTAYVLTRWKYGVDIREFGSGNPGARNSGRVYGKTHFILVFLGDACKGLLTVQLAQILFHNPLISMFALLFVLLGHLYPVWFQFRGGMGISTFIGGIAFFHLPLTGVLVVIFLVLFLISRSLTKAGLLTFILIPIGLWWYDYTLPVVIVNIIVIGFILWAHRK